MFKAWSTGRLAVITGGRIWLINVHTGVFSWAAGWGDDTHVIRKYICMYHVYIHMSTLNTNICIYNVYTCIYTIHTDICIHWGFLLAAAWWDCRTKFIRWCGYCNLCEVDITWPDSATSKDYFGIATFVTEDQLSVMLEVWGPSITMFCETKKTLLTTAEMIWEFDINFNRVKYQHHVVP